MLLKLLYNLKKRISIETRAMAQFTQILNPITGQNEWSVKDETYDYHQEIANAGFGDMLHDKERNEKYFAALHTTIARLHREGREAHVLDIGTGTGILSMMAVVAGANSVTACEAFLPMANCAERILEANGVAHKVRLIKKRSTEMVIGVDMPRKANVLVTEILDTELIGEGAIGIYNHAHDVLLTQDAVCIPAKARCYAQLAQSPLAAQWNSMKILANLDGEILLKRPKEQLECKGEAALHDVQLSQLPPDRFRIITPPIEIFEFDFNRKEARETKRSRNVTVEAVSGGSTELVFYWWDIRMDLEGDIVLSCAPFWAHPDLKELAANRLPARPLANVVPWRDHWLQAIYYIPKPLQVLEPGSSFVLNCNHDEYSLWFDVFPANNKNLAKSVPRHSCSCSLHKAFARSRIGQMNDAQRNKRYLRYLEDTIDKNSHVLTLSDGCILGLATAPLGASSVWCYEPHRSSRRFMETLVQANNLTNVHLIDDLLSLEENIFSSITHVFAEPYYLSSILPWDSFYFGTLLMKIHRKLASTVHISPHEARICAVPVEFLDLYKIRSPIKECEGFDLGLFDEMVNKATLLTHAKVEAQPLWEYPCRALGQSKELLRVVFRDFNECQSESGEIKIETDGSCNGIALWVEWHIDDSNNAKSVISTGPKEPVVNGEFIKWDMFVRQGVHLIGNPKTVTKGQSVVRWSLDFKPSIGCINFDFDVRS